MLPRSACTYLASEFENCALFLVLEKMNNNTSLSGLDTNDIIKNKNS